MTTNEAKAKVAALFKEEYPVEDQQKNVLISLLISEDGIEYVYIYPVDNEDQQDRNLRQLADTLMQEGTPVIALIFSMWYDEVIEIPPLILRLMLVNLNEKNRNGKILLRDNMRIPLL